MPGEARFEITVEELGALLSGIDLSSATRRKRDQRAAIGVHIDELHRDVQAECGRAVRLVPGCTVAHSHAPDQPDRRITAAQLEALTPTANQA